MDEIVRAGSLCRVHVRNAVQVDEGSGAMMFSCVMMRLNEVKVVNFGCQLVVKKVVPSFFRALW